VRREEEFHFQRQERWVPTVAVAQARAGRAAAREIASLLSLAGPVSSPCRAFLFACTAELSLLLSFATRSGGVVVLFFLLSS
jgi:hypothetical protein